MSVLIVSAVTFIALLYSTPDLLSEIVPLRASSGKYQQARYG